MYAFISTQLQLDWFYICHLLKNNWLSNIFNADDTDVDIVYEYSPETTE